MRPKGDRHTGVPRRVSRIYLGQRRVREFKCQRHRAPVLQRAVHCVVTASPDIPRSGLQAGRRSCASSVSAVVKPTHPLELLRMKAAAERQLQRSDLPWTIVRAEAFLELYQSARYIAADHILIAAHHHISSSLPRLNLLRPPRSATHLSGHNDLARPG